MKFGIGGLGPCRQHLNLCKGFQSLVSEVVSVSPRLVVVWRVQVLRLWSWVQVLDMSTAVCITSGKLFNLSEPQFPICKMGLIIIILPSSQSCRIAQSIK